jgi:hypothetical protein
VLRIHASLQGNTTQLFGAQFVSLWISLQRTRSRNPHDDVLIRAAGDLKGNSHC